MTIEQALALLTESQQALNQATLIEDRKRLDRHRIDLAAALAHCAAAAEAGYVQASESLKFMQESITRAREQLISIGSQRAGNDQGQALVQLKGAVKVMAAARQEVLREINGNHARLGTFNITIFGRTMTGKSTLMEILTRGDGASIGKGAQRATRDIRSYQWNGMKVSDIPGIAAFDGAEDEKLAHQAAEQADLIIYLITDDGPQLAEAEHLATLRNTGVPMLGICNVKRAVGDNRQLKLFLRTQERIFERQRLNEIINQFQQITDQYNAGPPVIFRSAHLEARRMADQSEYERIRTELMLASRFPDIEDHILKEVSTNGTFHRTRSFLRSASQASLSIWEQMLVCSNAAYEIRDRLKDHVGETETWRQQFKRDASQRIRSAFNGAIGTLRREIPAFAEDHCEDKQLSEKWNQRVQRAQINRSIQKAQRELHQTCVDKAQSLAVDLEREMATLSAQFQGSRIPTGPIANHRKIWDWSVLGISSGLGVAGLASWVGLLPLFSNPITLPIGIAVAVVAAVGATGRWLLGTRSKRRQKAIDNIVPQLHESLNKLESQAKDDFDRWVQQELVGGIVAKLIEQLEDAVRNADYAAHFYRQQAEALNRQQETLNRQLLKAAQSHVGATEYNADDMTVARVPGRMLAIRNHQGIELAPDLANRIGQVLQEKVICLPHNWTEREIINWATGNGSYVAIDQDRSTARAGFDPDDPKTWIRVSIAQQLTNLHIINEH